MERNIKTTITKPTRKVVFEFDVPIDWEPMLFACWTACPFSVCTNLGQVCLAQEHKNCPFSKNLRIEKEE